jgi:hypothetical protein
MPKPTFDINVDIDKYVDKVIDQNVDIVDGECLMKLNKIKEHRFPYSIGVGIQINLPSSCV